MPDTDRMRIGEQRPGNTQADWGGFRSKVSWDKLPHSTLQDVWFRCQVRDNLRTVVHALCGLAILIQQVVCSFAARFGTTYALCGLAI